MLRAFLNVTLLSFIASSLFLFSPFTVDAGDNVHRKSARQESVAEIYVTSWWPYCDQAKSYLASQGVKYKVYDIEKDPVAAKRKLLLDSGRGVPFAIINGVKISGWSQQMYESALQSIK